MTTNVRARSISEADLQKAIIELAQRLGYLVSHQRPARTEKGWRTAISGDPGFPDLVLVRPDRLILAELKSERGKLSHPQKVWGDRLRKLCQTVTLKTSGQTMPPVVYQVWRPSDYLDGLVEAVLR